MEALYNLFLLATFAVLIWGVVNLVSNSTFLRVTRRTVVKKVRSIWPQEAERALAELDRYELHRGFMRARVQLAIIKVSNGSLDELKRWVQIANIDWRDPLLYAEYPEEAEIDSGSEPDLRKARSRDRQRYVKWLRS